MIFTSFPLAILQPSVVCLGTGGFGTSTSQDDSFAMLDSFAEAGGNFADSAHIYAAWLEDGAGKSERTLGNWLRSRQPENFIVGTKGGHPHLESMEISRLSPDEIASDLTESLERLQRDQIELYWLHRDNPKIPVGEIIDALNVHFRTGQILSLGASNWSTPRIAAANSYAAKNGLTGFCASQICWSLAEVNAQMRGANGMVEMDETILAWHRENSFPIAAYSSQANGFFAHPLATENGSVTPKQKALAPAYWHSKNILRYQRAQELGARLNRSTHEVALAYVWSQTFPGVAIIGPRNLQQLRESLAVADLKLSSEEISLLETGAPIL